MENRDREVMEKTDIQQDRTGMEGLHPLSPRLQALYDMVPEGLKLADIGTDHGWLPIDLVKSGRIPSAIAMDLREGPLDRAKAHIEEEGLSAKIKTRLSDGFSEFQAGEADCAVISGMGGIVMQRILREAENRLSSLQVLILQPQSEIPEFREFLHTEGFRLVDEKIAEEEGKFYFLMKVLPPADQENEDLSSFWKSQGLPMPLCLKLGFQFGPVLLMKKDPALKRYLHHESDIQLEIAHSLEQADSQDERIQKRLQNLREDMALLNLALQIVERK
ncbi:MAG: class I SAM-dependent methyltransferase [Lachnospiraceae bacterium]|nr:class I SAM-dependent methyltransferase [Lachnospiraceae bacterium]